MGGFATVLGGNHLKPTSKLKKTYLRSASYADIKNLYLEGAALLNRLTAESITVTLIQIDEKQQRRYWRSGHQEGDYPAQLAGIFNMPPPPRTKRVAIIPQLLAIFSFGF